MKTTKSRPLRRIFGALGATAALLGASLAPVATAQAYDAAPGTVAALGSDPCLKGRGNCIIYPKSTQLDSGRLLMAYEKSTVPASGSAVGQTLPVMKSDDDGETWQPLAEVAAPAFMSDDPAVAKYTSNWTNPYLYVLPQDVGSLSAGTVLLATVVSGEDEYYVERKAADPNWEPTNDGDRRDLAIALYASTDEGQDWSFVDIIATGGWQGGSAGNIGSAISAKNTARQVDPLWEPHLLARDGMLVAYYSDENDYTGYDPATGVPALAADNDTAPDSGNQILVHRTWDGTAASWSAPVVDVSGGSRSMPDGRTVIGQGRPGMTTVAETSDGRWFLTFEYFGGGDNVRYKIADDPMGFFRDGDADGIPISTLPVEAGSRTLSTGGSPVITTLPDGRIAYNASGSGSVWVNASGSSTGQWVQYQTTVGGGYSRTMQYVEGTGRLVILHATWGGATAGSVIQRAHVDIGRSEGAYYQLVNRKTGQVIGTGGHSNDANLGARDVPDVRLETARAGDATQLWHLATKPDGTKTLLNASGGRAAAIWTGSATAGQRIGQWVDEGSTGPWIVVDAGAGRMKLQAAKNATLLITGSTTDAFLTLQNATTDGSQEWELVQQAPASAALTPVRASADLVPADTVAAGATITIDASVAFASGAPRHASAVGTAYLLDEAGVARLVGSVQLDAQQRGSLTLPADLTPSADLRLAVQFDESPLVWDAFAVATTSPAPLTAEASPRCVAGKVVVAVTVTNPRADAVTVDVTTPYGAKPAVKIAAGAVKALSFSTRLASAPAGIVTVTDAADAAFAAKTCG
ncbi:hypothetical protein RS84_00850 [Microbacterium hydrocarbonoxydans]|uniref:Ricin B lectin domain-containing protein n=1 Tax=Microbacterium hydrocarbonoxydans TaxID=273678 RepID=A0A0M2HW59_9MICO|nr:RICIN domain-containing protein [Microbacterium hydrocarbonoxydans]KJL48683.1 hypothetical protein RS84_00850 [Microbacterium hydrocarbonoxydans]